MESFNEFIGLIIIISLIVTLLNIILFFKIWAMTNDTRAIRDLLQEWLDIEHPVITENDDGKQNTKGTR